jgi:GH15 family glucan-1,4-alpha-glucosidase
LDGQEGTFTICTFWLVDNLAMQGRIAEARSLFERLLSYAGRLGLFSEEIESEHNIALGNYPQAFTHIALINSALNLKKAEMRLAEHHTDPVIAAIKLHDEKV